MPCYFYFLLYLLYIYIVSAVVEEGREGCNISPFFLLFPLLWRVRWAWEAAGRVKGVSGTGVVSNDR